MSLERQGADPIESCRLKVLANPRRGEHAPVCHHHDSGQGEVLPQLFHLPAHRARVGAVALEHLHRHRTSPPVTQQPEDDLELAALAVAGIAMLGQRTTTAFEVARREVVENQGAFGQVLLRQPLLDPLLTFHQPIHGPVEFVLIGIPHPQLFPKGVRQRVRIQAPRSGQLGARPQNPRGNQRHRQVPQARALGRQHPFEATEPHRSQHRSHMTMRPGA